MADRGLLKSSRVKREAFIAADRMLREDPSWPLPAVEREGYNSDVAKPVLAGDTADLDVLLNGGFDD